MDDEAERRVPQGVAVKVVVGERKLGEKLPKLTCGLVGTCLDTLPSYLYACLC